MNFIFKFLINKDESFVLSSDDDDSSEIDYNRNEKKIYNNSNFKVSEFNKLFLSCCDKMSLNEKDCNLFLEFIRLILPLDNNIPESYYKIKKLNHKSKIQEAFLCKTCEDKLDHKKKCTNEFCSSYNLTIKRPIKCYTANVKDQLNDILNKHYKTMIKYRGKIFYL